MKFVIVNQNEPTTELYHYGIKGQKWGVRRFQNPDGTLTPAGRARYLNSDGTLTKKGEKFSRKSKENTTTIKNEQRFKSRQDSLNKAGYTKDFEYSDGDIRMSKTLNTKHGKVNFSATVSPTRDSASGKDMKRAENHYNKYGDTINKRFDKEWEKHENGLEAYSGNSKLGKEVNLHYFKNRKNNGDTIEIERPIISTANDWEKGKTIGYAYAEFDGKTGKMLRISVDD